MQRLIDTAAAKNFVPILPGIVFTFIMLQVIGKPLAPGFYALWLSEAGFFLLAALVGCAARPNDALAAACFVLAGISMGVLLDVFAHPLTAEGYERNLFPIEIFAHTVFAMPVVFSVAAIFWLIAFVRRKRAVQHQRHNDSEKRSGDD